MSELAATADTGLGRIASCPELSTLQSLYGSPSFCKRTMDAKDPDPGPGQYELLSTLGEQPQSTKLTAPSPSMTAKHAKSWSKVLITKYHNAELLCRETATAGPYDPKLPQSQAGVRVGTGLRPPMFDKDSRSPGPVYDIRGRPEAKVSVAFGQDDRWRRDGEPSLGPGQYESLTQFDGVRLAKSFGVSFEAYRKVKTPGIEREKKGRESPGPGAFRLDFGQNLPNFNFSGVASVPRAHRFQRRKVGRMPGPGAYDSHRVLECTRPSVCSNINNQPCRSFGKPSTKPRLDFKNLRLYEHSTWGMN